MLFLLPLPTGSWYVLSYVVGDMMLHRGVSVAWETAEHCTHGKGRAGAQKGRESLYRRMADVPLAGLSTSDLTEGGQAKPAQALCLAPQ